MKEYFSNYFLHQSDVTIDLENNQMEVHQHDCEPWKVTLLETGLNTMTGGRIKRASKHIGNKPFLLTYGDGVSDVDITSLMEFHLKHGKKITMTAVQPAGRYGALNIQDNNIVSDFMEKPKGDGSWINGGFFVCEPDVLDEIEGDSTIFEQEPLTKLANSGELVAYKHHSFWQCMDTLRDKTNLSALWDQQKAPWKNWSD
jgi:glucose-1-phosphate cytidylyltransferase